MIHHLAVFKALEVGTQTTGATRVTLIQLLGTMVGILECSTLLVFHCCLEEHVMSEKRQLATPHLISLHRVLCV